MHILVGLGNPGAEYAGHRHNIGFMVIDKLAGASGVSSFSSKFGGEAAMAEIAGEKVLFLKPSTYMNHSGQSVSKAMLFYKLTPEKVIVFYDELDLEPGKVRVKMAGGAGGHNGIKSIDQHIGKNYLRVRIGIGHPGHKDAVSGYVLSNIPKAEQELQERTIRAVADHTPLLIKRDIDDFMNKVALTLNPPKHTPKEEKQVDGI